MNLEELKQEAAKHGYRLVKKREYIKLLPCPCGGERREHWYLLKGGEYYKCKKCGFKGDAGSNDYESRQGWNEAVKRIAGDAE